MASYIRRTVVTRTIEYLVPNGSAAAEFEKAWVAAINEWNRLNPDCVRADDWATIVGDEDYVIIRLNTVPDDISVESPATREPRLCKDHSFTVQANGGMWCARCGLAQIGNGESPAPRLMGAVQPA